VTSPRASGFTLLELLVAVFITAILFALGYAAINQALQNRAQVRAQQLRITDLQRAMRVLAQDITQAVPRPVRDRVGGGDEEAFKADPRITTLLALTRGGVPQLAGTPRAALQRIEYHFERDALWRWVWPTLDGVQANEAAKRRLLSPVRAVRFRFMDASGQWVDQWPTSTIAAPQRLRVRPIAVEVTLDTEDYGPLVRLIEVPG
jgi:general secretion pathway protein J